MTETLLPPNATGLETALETAVAERLESIPRLLRSTANPNTIPEVWLPWLAWAWRVENWDTDWPASRKRLAIRTSCEVHHQKGTVGAVRKALDALDVGIRVIEWFDDVPRRAPYTFRCEIELTSQSVRIRDWNDIIAIINTMKNERSGLSGIDVVTSDCDNREHHVGTSSSGVFMTCPVFDGMLEHSASAVLSGTELDIQEQSHERPPRNPGSY